MKVLVVAVPLLVACAPAEDPGGTSSALLLREDAAAVDAVELDLRGVRALVSGESDDEITVVVTSVVASGLPIEQLLTVDWDGERLRLGAVEVSGAGVTIAVPEGVRITGGVTDLPLTVEQVAGVDVISERGVTVRDVRFDVDVAVEDGPVNVERVGAVTARTVRGDVVVLDVEGRAELTSDDGHVRVTDVGALSVHDALGDVLVKRVAGDAFVHDGEGHVIIDEVEGRLEIIDGPGDIVISNSPDHVVLEDGEGAVVVH